MRFQGRKVYRSEPDMTPMLDMTFQLTFFFMLTLNFSSDIQSDQIRLPASEIARPTEGAAETAITVQVLEDGLVLFGGDKMAVGALQGPLQRERDVIHNVLGRNVKNVTVIVRADHNVPAGKFQEVLKICQEMGFESFKLRARQVSR
jgi:biopolymer transport protein ExbD